MHALNYKFVVENWNRFGGWNNKIYSKQYYSSYNNKNVFVLRYCSFVGDCIISTFRPRYILFILIWIIYHLHLYTVRTQYSYPVQQKKHTRTFTSKVLLHWSIIFSLEHCKLSCGMRSVTVEVLHKSAFLCSETNSPSENKDQQPVYSDEEISDMVDVLLTNSDLNNDGFIDYAEFKQTENNWTANSVWTVHMEWVTYMLCCKSEVSSWYFVSFTCICIK